jgi:hypothetical protein
MINNQIDRLIRRIKLFPELEGVRFVREYAGRRIETPISGYIAVVSLNKTERGEEFLGGLSGELRSECYRAEGEIRLFAPRSENGAGLSELSVRLISSLRAADEEGIITDAKVSAIEFEASLNAIFRRLSFTLDFCLCEEGLGV